MCTVQSTKNMAALDAFAGTTLSHLCKFELKPGCSDMRSAIQTRRPACSATHACMYALSTHLRGGVVAPHSHTADAGVELAGLQCQLRLGAVLIQASQRVEVPVGCWQGRNNLVLLFMQIAADTTACILPVFSSTITLLHQEYHCAYITPIQPSTSYKPARACLPSTPPDTCSLLLKTLTCGAGWVRSPWRSGRWCSKGCPQR